MSIFVDRGYALALHGDNEKWRERWRLIVHYLVRIELRAGSKASFSHVKARIRYYGTKYFACASYAMYLKAAKVKRNMLLSGKSQSYGMVEL